MMTRKEAVARLQDPVAVTLLESTIPARLAYTGLDGTPRVMPIWFHWDGRAFVLATPGGSPKIPAISKQPKVALTIDGDAWPYRVLLVRGTAKVETIDGMVPEYRISARRYLGEGRGEAWFSGMSKFVTQMSRITIEPEWVNVVDIGARLGPVLLPDG